MRSILVGLLLVAGCRQGATPAASSDLASGDAAMVAMADLSRGEDDLAGGPTTDFSSASDLAMGNADGAPPPDFAPAPALGFLGNTAAFVSGMMQSVKLTGDTVSHAAGVDVYTETGPSGGAMAVHLLYSNNDFMMGGAGGDLVMAFHRTVGGNDQWVATIPAQPAGTHIYWFIRADGWDGSKRYDSNNANNWDYSVN